MCFATTRSVGRDFLQVTGALGVVVNRNGILTTQRLFGKDVLQLHPGLIGLLLATPFQPLFQFHNTTILRGFLPYMRKYM